MNENIERAAETGPSYPSAIRFNAIRDIIGTIEHERAFLVLKVTESCDEIAALRREIEVLRKYGNNDCTIQADAALAVERAGGERA